MSGNTDSAIIVSWQSHSLSEQTASKRISELLDDNYYVSSSGTAHGNNYAYSWVLMVKEPVDPISEDE